jgi:hypothetical protein
MNARIARIYRASFGRENDRFRENKPNTLVFNSIRARIYRPSFGHENDPFRENKHKTLVFNPIRTQRRRLQLVLDEIKYWDCVEEEISWFSYAKQSL